MDESGNSSSNQPQTTTTSGKQRPHYKPKKTDSYVNKNANSDQLDLDSLSHEQLLVEAKRLQNHLAQLKNVVNKTSQGMESAMKNAEESNKKKKARSERPFDFSKFNKRHVFIKFAYLGWDYQVI